jgi:hypothetical protein
MRTFVVFAVLALAVSAFDLEAYTQGFSNQFGFTAAEMQDSYTCFAGASQIIGNVKTALQAGDLAGLITAVQQAKAQFMTSCGPYFVDFQTYATANADGQTPQQVMEQYGPQVIQQVATWANYLATGQDMEAGQTEAYILQILMGTQQPTVLPTPQYNWNNLTAFNQDAFFQQYLGAFFNTLGLAQEVNITSIQACATTVETLFQGFGQTEMAFVTGDFDGKIDAIQGLVDTVLQGMKSCQGALDANLLLLAPIYQAFSQDPVTFLLTVVDNTALNLPEIIQSVQQEEVDIAEGDYSDAGDLKAQRMQTVFNGVVNFAN